LPSVVKIPWAKNKKLKSKVGMARGTVVRQKKTKLIVYQYQIDMVYGD